MNFTLSKVLFIEKIMFPWTEFSISTMYVNKYFNPHSISNELNKYKCITHHYILQLHMSAWLGKEMNELNVKSPIWVSSVFLFFYIFYCIDIWLYSAVLLWFTFNRHKVIHMCDCFQYVCCVCSFPVFFQTFFFEEIYLFIIHFRIDET